MLVQVQGALASCQVSNSRGSQETRTWLLGNATVHGPGVVDYLSARRERYAGALVVETHVPASGIEEEAARLARKGWYTDFSPSQPEEGAAGRKGRG